MLSRVVLILLGLFWVTMNGLLWRAEYGSRRSGLGSVPEALVWEKILTSPDSSSLSISRHGRKVGFCRLTTSVGEEWGNVTDKTLPAGAPGRNPSYRLQVEGSVNLQDWTNHVRFNGSLKVDSHRQWQEFDARLNLRPGTWQLHCVVRDETVNFSVDDGIGHTERTFKFSDFRHPGLLLEGVAGPAAAGWLNALEDTSPSQPVAAPAKLGTRWDASEDMLKIGAGRTPVYRLQTDILERYRIVIFVSRVGEILRLELPGDCVLVNDQLTIL